MPVLHSIIHKIDKKPDGSTAVLHYAGTELAESEIRDDLMHQLNESYNVKQGKAWGLFHPESGAWPLTGGEDFIEFSKSAVEHLTKLMKESNLSVGGHALFCHYQQGLTQYLVIALLQETEAVTVAGGLALAPVRRLDLDHIHLAARINLSEWKGNPKSRQYTRSSRARAAARRTTTSATSSAARKASTAQARPAPCSRHSATSSKARTCQKTQPERRPRPWSATPWPSPSLASRLALRSCPN